MSKQRTHPDDSERRGLQSNQIESQRVEYDQPSPAPIKLALFFVLIFVFIIILLVVLLLAIFRWSPDSRHSVVPVNVTRLHVTDGEMEEERGITRPVTAGGRIEIMQLQNKQYCTHGSNGVYRASTKWGNGYRGNMAFLGPKFSWSSEHFYADEYEHQWLEMELGTKRRIDTIEFEGSRAHPVNTPTQYELQGYNDSIRSWVTMMEGSNPMAQGSKRRRHHVKHPDSFNKFRLLIKQTVWMERAYKGGYVQISYLELCWNPDSVGPPKPAEQIFDGDSSAESSVESSSTLPTSRPPEVTTRAGAYSSRYPEDQGGGEERDVTNVTDDYKNITDQRNAAPFLSVKNLMYHLVLTFWYLF